MHKNLNAEEIAILEEAALHIDPPSAEVESDLRGAGYWLLPRSLARILRPLAGKQYLGLVWRPARQDAKILVGKAQAKVNLPGRTFLTSSRCPTVARRRERRGARAFHI